MFSIISATVVADEELRHDRRMKLGETRKRKGRFLEKLLLFIDTEFV